MKKTTFSAAAILLPVPPATASSDKGNIQRYTRTGLCRSTVLLGSPATAGCAPRKTIATMRRKATARPVGAGERDDQRFGLDRDET